MPHSPPTPALPSTQYLRALAVRRLADDLGPDRAHHREAVVHLGDVDVLRREPRHLVRLRHRRARALGLQHVAAGAQQAVGGLRVSRDLARVSAFATPRRFRPSSVATITAA